jgi:hypothetical protein
MILDFATLDAFRTHHPAWRLLRSEHAPLIASFLHRVFIVSNIRVFAADPKLVVNRERTLEIAGVAGIGGAT